MVAEKKFVQDGVTKALVHQYLAGELERAGYSGMVMNRTPMGTQITVYAEKPSMVMGKGRKLIRKITRDLNRKFHLDNPQIDVQDVGKGDLNDQVVANRLASSLERGWYFRKAGQSMLRRVMDSGARDGEIIISGKLTGPHSRTEKLIAGYIKHSSKPVDDIVDKGYLLAIKKLGVIGCQVRIIPPETRTPNKFKIKKAQVTPEPQKKPAESAASIASEIASAHDLTEPKPVKKSDFDDVIEAEPSENAESSVKSTLAGCEPKAKDSQPAEVNKSKLEPSVEKDLMKIKRYTKISFPDSCTINKGFELSIQLTINELDSDIRKVIELLLPKLAKSAKLMIIITAPSFRIDRRYMQMEVPIDGDSEKVIFHLCPEKLGRQIIEVELFLHATRIGYITLETDVIEPITTPLAEM